MQSTDNDASFQIVSEEFEAMSDNREAARSFFMVRSGTRNKGVTVFASYQRARGHQPEELKGPIRDAALGYLQAYFGRGHRLAELPEILYYRHDLGTLSIDEDPYATRLPER